MNAEKTQTGKPTVWKILTSQLECEQIEQYAKSHKISEGEVFRRGLEALDIKKYATTSRRGAPFTSKTAKAARI